MKHMLTSKVHSLKFGATGCFFPHGPQGESRRPKYTSKLSQNVRRSYLTEHSVVPVHVQRNTTAPKNLTKSQEPDATQRLIKNCAHKRLVCLSAIASWGLNALAAIILATASTAAARGAASPGYAFPSRSSTPAATFRAPASLPPARGLSSSRPPKPLASISMSPTFQQQTTEAIWGCLAWINYKILQMLTFPAWGKLLTVLLVGIPILALGSGVLRALTGLSFKAALLRCYLILNNVPGVDIASEDDPRAAVVLNLVYTVGLLTFAALIGVIGDDISNAVEAARLGNSRVMERNHTVVLGHNRQLVEVVRQVALVRADRGAAAFPGQLVVLSHKDRATLESILVEALGPAAAGGVVTRQGSPLKVADLQRVSAGHARTVIMLAPEPDTAEADELEPSCCANDGGEVDNERVALVEPKTDYNINNGAIPPAVEGSGGGSGGGDGNGGIAAAACPLGLSLEARQSVTLAALHHLRREALQGPGARELGTAPQRVIVQNDADLDLLDPDVFTRGWGGVSGVGGSSGSVATGRHLVTPISHLNSFSRIQAQCASQPGLSAVMASVMQQQPGMPEFYVQHVPEVVGLTYGQARRIFPRAVLCGVYDPAAATAFTINSAEARLDAAAKAVVLNPPDSTPLLERYSLILLADRTTDLRVDHSRLNKLLLLAPKSSEGQHSQHQQEPHPHLGRHEHNRYQRRGTSEGGHPSGAVRERGSLESSSSSSSSAPRRATVAAAAAAITSSSKTATAKGTRAERGAAPARIVVLVFNGQKPDDLLEGLADYCPRGSEAVVVAAKDTAASRGTPISVPRPQQPLQPSWLRVRTVIGDPRTRGALRAAAVQDADAVILTGLEGADPDKADAQALATLIQLQALMPYFQPSIDSGDGAITAKDSTAEANSSKSSSSSSTGPGEELWPSLQDPPAAAALTRSPSLNLVCGVTDPRVREIMLRLVQVQSGGGGSGGGAVGPTSRRQVVIETINPNELLAGVLTQVAAEPRLSGLFHELSAAEGVEINLRTPAALGLPYNQPLTWDQIQDAGRERDVTVIGLLHSATTGGGTGTTATQPQPRLQLGLPLQLPAVTTSSTGGGGGGATMIFQMGDKVVVLSGEG